MNKIPTAIPRTKLIKKNETDQAWVAPVSLTMLQAAMQSLAEISS